MIRDRAARCLLLAAASCGHGAKPYKATGELAHGIDACGGALSLIGDWEKEKAGELEASGPVANVERIDHGVRVTLADARSFVISVDNKLAPPVAVGDSIDVEIQCQVVGWNALDCMGSVVANGQLVAFDTMTDATVGWRFERGPLVERRTHSNYGATSHYGLSVAYQGVTAVTPYQGCVELKTPSGTYRVTGGEVEHADPRAPDSADTSSFSVIRVP